MSKGEESTWVHEREMFIRSMYVRYTSGVVLVRGTRLSDVRGYDKKEGLASERETGRSAQARRLSERLVSGRSSDLVGGELGLRGEDEKAVEDT